MDFLPTITKKIKTKDIMKYNLITIILLFIINFSGIAQGNKLSEKEFLNIVKKYHPLALQAEVFVEQSKSDVLISRGAFDPLLLLNSNQKDLNNTQYYNYQLAQLSVPTWYGIEFNAGLENVGGFNTDPQETKGSSSFVGVSIPLMKNLVLDKRRATLQKAKIIVEKSKSEKDVILNDLLFEATQSYWNWVLVYQELRIVNDAILNITNRVNFTKNIVAIGERASIDTIEALTQLQSFQVRQNELQLELQNAIIDLSSFTWNENSIPYDLPIDIIPDQYFSLETIQYDETSLETYLEKASMTHPILKVYTNKLEYLNVEKQLAFQSLLPKLDFKYNQISKNYNLAATTIQPLFQTNFQYGINFSMPLRISEGRGEFRKSKLRIQEVKYDQDFKQRVILNKIKQEFNQLNTIVKQISVQNDLLRNQNVLLQGEKVKFENGESSLFLVNSREQKAIESQLKLNSNVIKYSKQLAKVKWASGTLIKE